MIAAIANWDIMGKEDIIGPNTSVKLASVCGMIAALASAIWWAASISTKLDAIAASQQQSIAAQAAQAAKMASLESRVAILEANGSELAKKLEVKVETLARDFEVHRASDKVKP